MSRPALRRPGKQGVNPGAANLPQGLAALPPHDGQYLGQDGYRNLRRAFCAKVQANWRANAPDGVVREAGLPQALEQDPGFGRAGD